MKKILFALILFVSFTVVASASSLGYLPGTGPVFRAFDTTGTKALISGKLVTCQPGSVCGCSSWTSKTSYQDDAGLIPNSNPVSLDATGSARVWLSGSYKIVLCDRFNVAQWSQDNVYGVSAIASAATATSSGEWVDSGVGTITGLNTTSFSVVGDKRSIFPTYIRLKANVAGGTSYATVLSSTYNGFSLTTVVVALDNALQPLTGITAVSTGIISPINTSLPIFYTANTWTGGQSFTGGMSSSVTSSLTGTMYISGTISGNNTWNGNQAISGNINSSGSNSWLGANLFSGLTSSGTITGNVVGNVTGNVTGDLTGNVTGGLLSGVSAGGTAAVTGANSSTGNGVNGSSTNSTGSGVYGTNSANGRGVYGSNSDTGPGVFGSSATGRGVYGIAGGFGVGVYGSVTGTGAGVQGNNNGNGYGVEGLGSNAGSTGGVHGYTTSSSGYGVIGENNGATGDAVFGSAAGSGRGVVGYSATGRGVHCIGASCGGTQAWTNDSDERLKNSITTIPNALDKVLQLRGVYFNWNAYPQNGRQTGFIAQEVLEVMPEVVTMNPQTGYYGMEQSALTAVLVEAIKELKVEVDVLREEVKNLKGN